MKDFLLRTLASISMAALMTFNSIPISGASFPKNPFEKEDSLRQKIIGSATNKNHKQISLNRHVMGASERYIAVFKENASFSKIKKALEGYNYRLLADSDERIFLVYIESEEDFSEKNKDILNSLEKDSIKETYAYYPNDTYSKTYELELLGMSEAWEYTLGDQNVTVAIIDSGIDRNHEDFSQTHILSGFDYENGQSNVSSDVSGHGTKIAGIIAATGNNGVGCVGIAPKCTLLPIKVTNSEGKIYTSDLIDSLYLAADSGADVINMSLGNYDKIESEEKAIKYANEKGCILVAAAGNEGNHSEFAGMKCYPASYDGVISVGAVDESGKSCIFSQHNDAVDISAPGSGLSLLMSGGGYTADSGTSFSAAYISGVAALALSILDDGHKMNSDQFDYLISSNAYGSDDPRLGAGLLNAPSVLKNTNLPLVSGVENGGIYYDNLKIFFNRGTATLDGDDFKSGDLCKHTGEHTLRVSDGDAVTEIKFITDNLPLSCTLKDGDGYSYISFPFGTATLNGHPYISDDKITSDGKHTLVLTGLYGNSKTFEFYLSFSAPIISGVKDGEIYDTPIRFSVSTGGKIYLDGKESDPETTVYEEGEHTLLIRQNGNIKTTINFTISYEKSDNPYKYQTVDTAIANARSVSGFGVIAVWNEINRGIRLYDAETAQLIRYLSVGENVTNVYFDDEYLYIAGTNRVFGLKSEDLRSNISLSVLHTFEFPVSATDFCENFVYYSESSSVASSNIKKFSLDTFETTDICFVRAVPDVISYDKSTDSVAFSKKEDKKIYISSVEGGNISMVTPFDDLDKGFIFRNGKISCGGTVFLLENSKNIFCTNDSSTLYFDGTTLITEKGIYNTETNEIMGYHGLNFSHICYSSGIYSAIYNDVTLYISHLLPSVPSVSPTVSHGKDYGFTQTLTFSKNFTQTVENNGKIFASGNENLIYIFDASSFKFINQIQLPFVPKEIKSSGENIYIYSDKTNTTAIYSTKANKTSFIDLPCTVSRLSVYGDYIAFVGKDALYVHDLQGNEIFFDDSEKYISVSFSHDGKNIYTIKQRSFYTVLTSYNTQDFSAEYERVLDYEANDIFCDSTYIYINTAAYLTRDGSLSASCSSKIYGKYSTVFITAKGLFSEDTFLSSYNASGTAFVLKENGELLVFEGNSVSIFKNPYGGELLTPLVIPELEDNGNYTHNVPINLSKGIGYMDSILIKNGHIVADGGNHVLQVVLPYGIKYSFRFVINASLSSIKIKGGDTAIKVNDTKTFKVSFLPAGSPEEEIMFYCESDIVSVTSQGVVTGLKAGEAKLFAATMDGRIVTSINISVLSSMLSFTPSFLGTDRENGILYGISSGTTVDALLSFLDPSLKENTTVFHGEEKAEGLVKTGMKIVLTNKKGEILDSLLISVIGDCNGDGNVDIGDLTTACQLMNDEDAEAVFIKSADFSNTGTIDAADTFTYKEIILGNEKIVDNANIITDSYNKNISFEWMEEKNGTISVILSAESHEINGISGKIFYDNESLTFISAEKSGYINTAEDFGDHIRFLSVLNRMENKNDDKKTVLMRLNFLPSSKDDKIFKAEDILVFTDKTAKSDNLSVVVSIEQGTEEKLLESLSPSSGVLIPEFSPDVYTYVLRLPYGTETVDFSHVGKGELIVKNNTSLSDGSIIKVLYEEKEYTINIIMESKTIDEKEGIPLWITILILSLVAIVIIFIFLGKNIIQKIFPKVEHHD